MLYDFKLITCIESNIEKYEIEEVDHVCCIKVEINHAYDIIHNRSYGGVLFPIIENYKYVM